MLGERVKWENSKRIVRHGFLLMLLLWGTVEVGYGTNDPTKESPSFAVTINPVPEIELSETYIRLPINTSQAFPTVSCTGCGTPVWQDALENTHSQIPARSTAGLTAYTVNVSNGSCTAQKQIVVDVYDPDYECGQKERKYAS